MRGFQHFGAINFPSGLYYCLPVELVELITEPHRGMLNASQISREKELANAACTLKAIGFRNGNFVKHRFLTKEIERGLEPLLAQQGVEVPQATATEMYRTLEQTHRFLQAYCGWLMSNEYFLAELDKIVLRVNEGSNLRFPQLAIARLFKPQSLGDNDFEHRTNELSKGSESELVSRYGQFLEKWRLQSMETADLPRPLEPQFTSSSAYTGPLPQGLSAPVIPDIYPVEGKGAIADQVQSTRTSNGHLADWKAIISPSSRVKKRVDSLGRQFQLQHFWRVLFQRYPGALSRKRMKLQELFAEYFSVAIDSIKRDLKVIDPVCTRTLSSEL